MPPCVEQERSAANAGKALRVFLRVIREYVDIELAAGSQDIPRLVDIVPRDLRDNRAVGSDNVREIGSVRLKYLPRAAEMVEQSESVLASGVRTGRKPDKINKFFDIVIQSQPVIPDPPPDL